MARFGGPSFCQTRTGSVIVVQRKTYYHPWNDNDPYDNEDIVLLLVATIAILISLARVLMVTA